VTTQFVSEGFGVAENFRPNEGGPGVAWDPAAQTRIVLRRSPEAAMTSKPNTPTRELDSPTASSSNPLRSTGRSGDIAGPRLSCGTCRLQPRSASWALHAQPAEDYSIHQRHATGQVANSIVILPGIR
jgi:hypothetical protein